MGSALPRQMVGSGGMRLELKIGPGVGGQFGIMEDVLPPGAGPASYCHQHYNEAFYVLDGEIKYCIGDEWITATAGTCVFAPAGCRTHSSETPVRAMPDSSSLQLQLRPSS